MNRFFLRFAVGVGSGLVVSFIGWKIYKYYKEMETNNRDEGFEDVPKEGEPSERKVLVLGLDQAGKSCLLQSLSYDEQSESPRPTQGFNILCLDKQVPPITIWEIGGADNMRGYWSNFIQDTCVLVYVVDSSDQHRIAASYEELHKVLGDERLHGVPVIIVANKQDKAGALTPEQVLHSMSLDHLSPKQHPVHVLGTSVTPDSSSQGSEEFRSLLLSLV